MADRVIFVCTLILAGVYFYATEQLPSLEIGDPLGPKAFPRLLGIGLVITAIVLLLEILRARKTTPATAPARLPHNRRSMLGGSQVAIPANFRRATSKTQARWMSSIQQRSKTSASLSEAGAAASSASYRSESSTALAKIDGFDVPPVT